MTGFDNIEFSTVTTPSITTVDQPRIRLGLMACELLVEKLRTRPCLRRACCWRRAYRAESTSNSRAVAPEPFRRSFLKRRAAPRGTAMVPRGHAYALVCLGHGGAPFTHRGVRY